MRLAARLMTAMAAVLVIGPALYADDAVKPAVPETSEAAAVASTAIAPTPVAPGSPDTEPGTSVAQPAASSASRPSQSGRSAQAAGTSYRDPPESDTPKLEWFMGYSFWRAMPTSTNNRMGYLHGGSTSLAYNFNKYLGLVADFGGFDNSRLTLFSPTGSRTVDADGSVYTYTAGPRFSYRKYERFTPFVQALAGGTHASAVTISGCTGSPSCAPLGTDNAFAAMFGAGFDIKISRHFALRPFEGDFLLTHFDDASTTGAAVRGWQKNARFSTGMVFRFGGHPAAVPSASIAATCSADRGSVYAGSGDFIGVRADTSNPDNRPLNYSWSASEGTVDGTGPEVRWSSADRRPGTYTIQVRVDNGRNGTADCSANVRVEVRPNRSPTMSCSTSQTVVTAGEPIDVAATASDPDDDPLSFSWQASGGRIEGSGSTVRFRTGDLAPGSYTITGHVNDGRDGTADCTESVEVRAAQKSAEVQELEKRLALHSVYFATAKPNAADPTGGLLESQQTVLLALANDFNRYLTFNPQAHLIFEGHADMRGTIEYNQELTSRRVAGTKSFLVEHGVPAANIETRALGDQQNLDAAQVKQLVDQNPDLSNDERERIEQNLQVIVWANNRRVDISLNTTGQQSIRQYPFNAKDSLALLSATNTETGKPKKAAIGKKIASR